MSDDLTDALQEIGGIGPAKAEAIIEVLPDETGEHDPLIAKAIEAADAGDDRTAAVFLRRAAGGE